MIYITGDTHGNFNAIEKFCHKNRTTADDIIIILGDAGLNFLGAERDNGKKRYISYMPITLLCIHGNHEKRPETIPSYDVYQWRGGLVYREPDYPNILFAMCGEIYDLDGLRCIAIGGANSVDKGFRREGHDWWADEQPSEAIKMRVENRLHAQAWKVDIVLSHTCPYKYLPREALLSGINPRYIDNSTEEWLDKLEDRLIYQRWYCGHFHIEKHINQMRFMYKSIEKLI